MRVAEALREGAPPSSWEPLVARGLELVADRRDAAWARLAVAVDPVETVANGPLYAGRWRGYPAEAVAVLRSTGADDDEARAIEPFAPRSEAETLALLDRSRLWSSARARMRALDVAGRDFSFRHGRPLSAVDCYRELLEVGERVGSRAARAEASSQLALCLALVGEIEEAQEYLARAGVLVRDLWPGHRLHLLGTLSSTVIVGYVQGSADWVGVAQRLTTWVRSPAAAKAMFANVFGSLAALCHAFAGNGDEAGALLREVASVLARMEPQDHAVPGSVWFAAAAAWQLGDAEAAARLSPLVERHEAAGGPPGPMASLVQAAGWIAALRGDAEEAVARFARARLEMEVRGLRSVRALLDLDEATMRADRGLAARSPAG